MILAAGALVTDIVNTVVITAIQAQDAEHESVVSILVYGCLSPEPCGLSEFSVRSVRNFGCGMLRGKWRGKQT